MKYYAVIYTNVLFSSLLKRDSNQGLVYDYVLIGTIIPLLNEEIINEYVTVLTRNKFNFDETVIQDTLNVIKQNAIFLEREQSL